MIWWSWKLMVSPGRLYHPAAVTTLGDYGKDLTLQWAELKTISWPWTIVLKMRYDMLLLTLDLLASGLALGRLETLGQQTVETNCGCQSDNLVHSSRWLCKDSFSNQTNWNQAGTLQTATSVTWIYHHITHGNVPSIMERAQIKEWHICGTDATTACQTCDCW